MQPADQINAAYRPPVEPGGTLPLAAHPHLPEPFSARRQQQILWLLLAVGVAARVVRYLLAFPLWADECALVANLLDRGYLELLQPLDHEQVCPLGFLWAQLTLVRWLGFTEYTLRLPAFACSLASLFLFRHWAGRLLRGTALLLAVGVFAVAYPLIRYTAEAKPYGCDLLLGLLLLLLATEWWHSGLRQRWLWALTALAPLALLFSYPVVFVAGGLSLATAHTLWTTGARRAWLPWIAYNLALAGSAGAVFLLFGHAQSASELVSMRVYWQDCFPPLLQPARLPAWLLDVHTGQMLAYPVGDHHGGSTLTLLGCAAAVAVLCKRRQFRVLLLCVAPLGLTLVAAAMQRYPYGGMVRFQLYLAPVFCLLAGLGFAALLARIPSWVPRLADPAVTALAVLIGIGVICVGRDLANPAKGRVDVEHRDLARWLWRDLARDAEVVCLKADLKQSFSPATFGRRTSAVYLANQRIHSPRHARGEPPQWDRVSTARPLRCVHFVEPCMGYDESACRQWLDTMAAHYDLVARDRYCLGEGEPNPGLPAAEVFVEVFTFVPKPDGAEQLGGIASTGQGLVR